jgi:hypothetical protein
VTVLTFPVRKIADQELALLAEMALHPTGRRYPRVPAQVESLAAPDHTDETLLLAWTDFKEAVYAREDVATDGDKWREYFDPEDCAGSEHAIEMLSERIDDAYRAIRNRPRS